MTFAAVGDQSPRVDRIGLAEDPEGADERLDLAGIGAMGGNAGRDGGPQQSVLVAAGGFADDQASRVEPGDEGVEGLATVFEGGEAIGTAVLNDDGGLADVAADDRRGGSGLNAHVDLSFGSL